ncbi:hypothetical protein [Pseudorhodobacter sp.]|uniref:hypothetical protein n=1 Tax=Pseudorhodobacter sp. TaxID=1934400 RepID=UPI0026494BEB|nr:hypothetical protein [Pseudorhodobacter sp.]MDN5787986.1 hypothetical protein [Pseudorhodobacter sp.]
MAIDFSAGDIQGFGHVRIVIGLVTGLSVTRILNGFSRFVQHPGKMPIYPAHFIWAVFMLVFVTHFWWFQFGLSTITKWAYPEYAFVISYAALIFFISSLLFPDQMGEYSGFEDYFNSRARWFYGLLAALFLVDMADSAIKGADHFQSMGSMYPVRQLILAGLALTGMFVRQRFYHITFGILAIALQIWQIYSRFFLLD